MFTFDKEFKDTLLNHEKNNNKKSKYLTVLPNGAL